MKTKLLIPILFLSLFVIGQSNDYESFSLKFYSVGYGSNMDQAQPVFKVNGQRFIYKNENAWTDSNNFFTEFNDTVCLGEFRISSIDSVISFVEKYKDTVLTKSNPEIMSGKSDYLIVKFNGFQTTFELDNDYDSALYQIVQILNSYIPDKNKRIWVYEKEIKTGYNNK